MRSNQTGSNDAAAARIAAARQAAIEAARQAAIQAAREAVRQGAQQQSQVSQPAPPRMANEASSVNGASSQARAGGPTGEVAVAAAPVSAASEAELLAALGVPVGGAEAAAYMNQLRQQVEGLPPESVPAISQLLYNPQEFYQQGQSLVGSPYQQQARPDAEAIAGAATGPNLAQQLASNPDLSSYPEETLNQLAAFRQAPSAEVQEALDAAALETLSGDFDPETLNPAMAHILRTSENPEVQARLTERLESWASEKLESSLAGKEKEEGAQEGLAEFQEAVVALVEQTGLGEELQGVAERTLEQGQGLIEETTERGRSAWDRVTGAVSGLIEGAFTAVGNAITTAIGAVGNVAEFALDKTGDVWESGLDLAAAGFDAVGLEGAADATRTVGDAVDGAYDWVGGQADNFVDGAADALGGAVTGIGSTIAHPVETIKGISHLVTNPSEIVNVGRALWDEASQHGIAGALGYVAGSLAPALLTGGSSSTSLLGRAGNIITSTNAYQAAATVVRGTAVYRNVIGPVLSGATRAATAAAGAIDNVAGAASTAFRGAKRFVNESPTLGPLAQRAGQNAVVRSIGGNFRSFREATRRARVGIPEGNAAPIADNLGRRLGERLGGVQNSVNSFLDGAERGAIRRIDNSALGGAIERRSVNRILGNESTRRSIADVASEVRAQRLLGEVPELKTELRARRAAFTEANPNARISDAQLLSELDGETLSRFGRNVGEARVPLTPDDIRLISPDELSSHADLINHAELEAIGVGSGDVVDAVRIKQQLDSVYFTDPHGSPENFRAALQGRPGGQGVVLGGDYINVGPNSREAVQVLRQNPLAEAIIGNHDINLIAAFEPVPTPQALLGQGTPEELASLQTRARNLGIDVEQSPLVVAEELSRKLADGQANNLGQLVNKTNFHDGTAGAYGIVDADKFAEIAGSPEAVRAYVDSVREHIPEIGGRQTRLASGVLGDLEAGRLPSAEQLAALDAEVLVTRLSRNGGDLSSLADELGESLSPGQRAGLTELLDDTGYLKERLKVFHVDDQGSLYTHAGIPYEVDPATGEFTRLAPERITDAQHLADNGHFLDLGSLDSDHSPLFAGAQPLDGSDPAVQARIAAGTARGRGGSRASSQVGLDIEGVNQAEIDRAFQAFAGEGRPIERIIIGHDSRGASAGFVRGAQSQLADHEFRAQTLRSIDDPVEQFDRAIEFSGSRLDDAQRRAIAETIVEGGGVDDALTRIGREGDDGLRATLGDLADRRADLPGIHQEAYDRTLARFQAEQARFSNTGGNIVGEHENRVIFADTNLRDQSLDDYLQSPGSRLHIDRRGVIRRQDLNFVDGAGRPLPVGDRQALLTDYRTVEVDGVRSLVEDANGRLVAPWEVQFTPDGGLAPGLTAQPAPDSRFLVIDGHQRVVPDISVDSHTLEIFESGDFYTEGLREWFAQHGGYVATAAIPVADEAREQQQA